MNIIQLEKVNTNELINLIVDRLKNELKEFSIKLNSEPTELLKPHLTRKETAQYFNISLNCLTIWCNKGIIKPYKVSQRVFFKREEILRVMFDQSKQA
jgi:hypothetical protein